MKRLFTFLCAFAICFCAFAQQPPIYVTPTGAGTMSGNSWANARSGAMLRQTLKTIPTHYTAQAVWIKKGTYYPHANKRDSCFVIAPHIHAFGGFAGTETGLSQRNIQAHETILSGDIGVAGDSSDNTYHVVAFEIGSNNLVDGFTIRDGNADGDPNNFYPNMFGGGIVQIAQGTPTVRYEVTVRNCLITKNYAHNGGGFAHVAYAGHSDITLENCRFVNNRAYTGGGVYAPGQLKLRMYGCQVDSNTAAENGGGLWMKSTTATNPIWATKCTFNHNKAIVGGSIYMDYVGTYGGNIEIRIDSSEINHNISKSTANAMLLYVRRKDTARIYLTNSDVSYNTCLDSGYTAVAVWTNTYSVKETRRYFTNTTFTYNAEGISNYTRVPLLIHSDTSAQQTFPAGTDSSFITNCLFANNNKGAALDINSTDGARMAVVMANSTVYGDTMHSRSSGFLNQSATQYEGSHRQTECVFYGVNSIIYHTTPNYLLGSPYQIYRYQSAFLPPNAARSSFKNCYVSGTPANGPFPSTYGDGGGNILAYPKFRDTANNDFRLACNSPGVNAGNNALYYGLGGGLTDLDGRVRVYNSVIDMGAYEQDLTTAKPVPRPVTTKNGLTINYSSTTNADTLIWDFGNGTKVKARSGSYTYSRADTYNVCLRAVNACGFRDSCFRFVAGNPSAVPTVTPFGAPELLLFPNPAEASIQLSETALFVEVHIYDLMGQCVWKVLKTSQATLSPIDISQLPAGLYLLKALDEKGQSQWGKFLKR